MIDVLIVMRGAKDLKRVKRLIGSFGKNETYKVLSCEFAIEKESAPYGVTPCYFTEYPVCSLQRINEQKREALRVVKEEIPGCSVEDTTLDKVFTIDTIPLWSIVWRIIYIWDERLFSRYFYLIPVILNSEKPKRIIFTSRRLWFSRIFDRFAADSRIQVEYPEMYLNPKNLKSLVKKFIRIPIKYCMLYGAVIKNFAVKLLKRKKPRQVSKRKIVFLNTTAMQMRTLLPVAALLRANEQNDVVCITKKNRAVKEDLKKNGIRCKDFDDYLHFGTIREMRILQKRCSDTWSKVVRNRESLNGIRQDGMSPWCFIEPLLEHMFFGAFNPIAKNLSLSRSIVKNEKPDIVIYTDEGDILVKHITLLAKKMGIPVLRIQYALLDTFDRASMDADAYAMSGEFFKELVVKENPDSLKNIFVTGQPRYDAFFSGKNDYRELKKRYLHETDRKVIVLGAPCFTSGRKESDPQAIQHYYVWIQETYKALSRFGNTHIIIKPHHNAFNTEAFYKKIMKDFGAPKHFTLCSSKSNIMDLIQIADVYVTWGSTTVLEAMIFRKPMVIVNLNDIVDPNEYLQEEIAEMVYEKEDIYPAVKKVLENEEVQNRLKYNQGKILEKVLYKTDGKASERVTALIERMYNAKK